jgi:phosphate:Na+ symporter
MELFKAFLLLLAGVGIFIVGMNMMGNGLEKGAGNGLKRLLAKISNNRFAGIGIGAGVTAIVQSSSATSVMVIGLVNAGVMTLFQAASVIFGANIGTTVTGLIVALSGTKGAISFSDIAIVLAFIGVMMTFFKKEKVKLIGNIICGLGVIFVGLEIMGDALDANSHPEIADFFKGLFASIDFPLLLILFGAIFTALIQSSSAATGIVIVMAGQGVISIEAALFIVLGSNIGTCVTALLACIGTGTNAKRTTFIHFFIKIVGTLIFTAFMWPTGSWLSDLLASTGLNHEFQIALFHVVFNVINTIILLPFLNPIVKLSELVIKDKEVKEETYKLKFVDERLLVTPAIAYEQVRKEILYMATLANDNVVNSLNEIGSPNGRGPDIYEKEATINFTNKALTDFLIKLSGEANEDEEKHIGAWFHVINDLERIGDHAKNFLEISEELTEKNLALSESAKSEVALMASKVARMFELAIEVFEIDKADVASVSAKLAELSTIEAETDRLKKEYISNHFARLADGKCDASHSPYYMSVVTRLERVADHLINVGYSIVNPTGSQA